jgi:transposase InsO family protein
LASDLLIKSCNEENVGYDELTLHQDNGAVMRGSVFMSTMSALGVKGPYSRPGVSDDNSLLKSLFRTMKVQHIQLKKHQSQPNT